MSAAFDPSAWSDFFVAEAGAAAALTGLVIVAISINLQRIIQTRLLTGRALETIVLLTNVLIFATLGLVPGQGVAVLGVEYLALGALVFIATALILYRVRAIHHPNEYRWLRWVLNWGASLPVMLAGLSLLLAEGGGLYWLVAAVLVALVGGILNTWVLLVEILR